MDDYPNKSDMETDENDQQRIIRASFLDEGSLSFLDGSYASVSSVDEGDGVNGAHSAVHMAYDTYCGTDSQSGIRMGEEKMAGGSSVEEDGLDTRNFLKESRTLMVGGLSVEKSLLNSYGVKTSVESREDETSASLDLAKLSVSSGFFRQSNFSQVNEEEILKMNAWASFKKHSIAQGDLRMDGGSRGVPVQHLPDALSRIARSIPILELSMIVARQQYPSKSVLKWQEFNALAHEIFHLNRDTTKQGTFGGVKTPLQAMRTTPSQHRLDVQRANSRMGLSSPKQSHQPQSRHHPDESERMMMSQVHHQSLMSEISLGGDYDYLNSNTKAGGYTGREAAGMSVSKVPQMKMKPFERLLQKQRAASSIVVNHLPTGATNDVGTSASFVDINGQKVATKKLNDLMCKKFKTENSLQRRQRQEMQALYPLKDLTMSKAESLQRLSRPLTKTKVFAMTHQQDTYAGKWKKMREKREARYLRDDKKASRQATLNTVTRLVADGEKASMYKFLQERNAVEQVLAENHVEQRREVEREIQDHIEQRREEQRLERSVSAASMKTAIVRSVEATRAALREEYRERKAQADEHKFKLDDDSSALLIVPEDITKGISKARTLERWNDAKAREKKYLEDTMDSRIREYARKKVQKLYSAAENVTQFSHTPLDRQAATPFDINIGSGYDVNGTNGGGEQLNSRQQQHRYNNNHGYYDPHAYAGLLNEASMVSSMTNPVGVAPYSQGGTGGGAVTGQKGTSPSRGGGGGGGQRSSPGQGGQGRGISNTTAYSQGLGTPQQYLFSPDNTPGGVVSNPKDFPNSPGAGKQVNINLNVTGAMKQTSMNLVRRSNAAMEMEQDQYKNGVKRGGVVIDNAESGGININTGMGVGNVRIPGPGGMNSGYDNDDQSFRSLATNDTDGDDELNVMAIREYISTRSRMEEGNDDEGDNIGNIIRSGLPESPVPFGESAEPMDSHHKSYSESAEHSLGRGFEETEQEQGDVRGLKGNNKAKRLPKLRTPGHGDTSASLDDLSSSQRGDADATFKPSLRDSVSSEEGLY